MRRLAVMFTGFAVALLLAGCSAGAAVTMPDVVGKRLDVAISDVKRAGSDKEVEVLGGGLFGVIDKSNWTVCSQEPANGTVLSSAPRLTVDRTCEGAGAPSGKPSENPTPNPEMAAPTAEAYSYQGPHYEIVTVDEGMGSAKLTQYWVYTSKFDYSTEGFKDQVKLIVADIASKEKTAKLIVQVVTDKEIIEAESKSTIGPFMDEHGADYWKSVMVPKENTDWVAWYTGGFDPDTAQPSESASAFEIAWLPEGHQTTEKWMPALAG